MATFNLTVRLEMLKELGVTVQYSEHVQEEAANDETARDSEEEFPAVVPPKPEQYTSVHDAGHDAWNSVVHTSNSAQEQQKLKGMDDSSAVMPLDYSKFVVGEPADESISFCSWKVIEAYPDQFIGKANRPRVCTDLIPCNMESRREQGRKYLTACRPNRTLTRFWKTESGICRYLKLMHL